MMRDASLALAGALVVACTSPSAPSKPIQLAAAPKVEVISGDSQIDTVARQLPLPLLVRVVDTTPVLTGGQPTPVAGQIVNFVVTSGGGHVFAGSSVSDSLGRVQELWTLGDTAKVQTLEARAVDNSTGAPLTFAVLHATALPGLLVHQGFLKTWIRITGDSILTLPRTATDSFGNPLPPAPAVALDSLGTDAGGAIVTPDRPGWFRYVLGTDTLKLWVHVPAAHYRLVQHHVDTTWTETGVLTATTLTGPTYCGNDYSTTADSTLGYRSDSILALRSVGGGSPDTLEAGGARSDAMCHALYPAQHTGSNWVVYIKPAVPRSAALLDVNGAIDATWIGTQAGTWAFLLNLAGATDTLAISP